MRTTPARENQRSTASKNGAQRQRSGLPLLPINHARAVVDLQLVNQVGEQVPEQGIADRTQTDQDQIDRGKQPRPRRTGDEVPMEDEQKQGQEARNEPVHQPGDAAGSECRVLGMLRPVPRASEPPDRFQADQKQAAMLKAASKKK